MYQPKTISGKEMVADGAYPVFGANGIIGRYDQFNHAEPQLLITCRGATCGSVNVSLPNSWITGNAMVVRPKDESIDLRYLEYYFRGGIDISIAITGAAQPQITRTNLDPLTIQYPTSLDEQRRIVAVLDKAFAGIATATANAQKNLTNARALFESCRCNIFQRGIKDSKAVGWEIKTLGEVSDFQGGSQPPKSNFVDQPREGYVRLLQIRDFKSDKWAVYVPIAKGNKLCQESDIMIGRYGASVGQIHRGKGGAYNVALIRTIPNLKIIDREFFYHYLKSDLFQKPLFSVADRSAQAGFSKDDIAPIPIPLPPIDEQGRIADELNTMNQVVANLTSIYDSKVAALTELKQSLLHKAFAGELT